MSVRIDYRPEEVYCRQKDGCILPVTPGSVLKRLYGEEMEEFGGVVMSPCRCYFINEKEQAIMPAKVLRRIGTIGTPVQRLSSYATIPNGQVKNFLNACRGSYGLKGAVRVAVVGSKAHEGGGVWHKYFALYLAQTCTTVVIDFFDFSEVDSEWNFSYSGVNISCEWVAEPRTPEQLMRSDYDCIIDDVWTYEQGSGIGMLDVPFYSLKGRPDSEGFIPFLHASETRKFSSPCSAVKIAGCTCMVCRVCKEVSSTYEQYMYVRSFCSRLGHATQCLGVGYSQELATLNVMHLSLLQNPVFKVEGPSLWRFVVALSEEMHLDVEGDAVWRSKGDPRFLPARRFAEKGGRHTAQVAELEYDWLRGRHVTFSGVTPEILAATPILVGGQDVLIAASEEVLLVNSGYRFVYLPTDCVMFPSWVRTGRSIGRKRKFFEYAWRPPQLKSEQHYTMRVGQIFRGSFYKDISLFPSLDTSVLLEPLLEKQNKGRGTLYSVVRKGLQFELIPFLFSRWRHSIWVKGSIWGLISVENFSDFPDELCLWGAYKIPWDVTPEELLLYEKECPVVRRQKVIREHFVQQQVLTPQDMKQKCYDGDVVTLHVALNSQKEFVVIRIGLNFRLDLSRNAVWSGSQPDDLAMAFIEARNQKKISVYTDSLLRYSLSYMK